ncbi:MAG: hypothetical protein QOH58_103 [Thermoleophilaceae bacterium]|nr:hypothetical protein [Thermoleophilaceae bacterium]
MDEPLLLGPGEGEPHGVAQLKVDLPELSLAESVYEAGRRGPPPHIHRVHVDAFYVIDGRLEFELGPDGQRFQIEPGGLVLVPPEVVHSFHNPGPGECRFLNIHAPGADFGDYLRTRGEAPFDSEDPPPGGGRPASDAIVLGADEGERLAFGPTVATLKAGVDDALGSFALTDSTIAGGFPGPVPHRHERMVDSFYVLEGTLALRLGEQEAIAGPGSYACVPPGNAHTFSNPGTEPVRVLNLMAPGGLEGYLRELAKLGGPPDPAVMARIAADYDFLAL